MLKFDQCLDVSNMLNALIASQISEDTFNQWVSNYFLQFTPIVPPPPPPVPKPMDADEIRQLLNYPNYNCGSFVQVTCDNQNPSNDDINVTVTPVMQPQGVIDKFYYIALFNAFFAILDPIMPIDNFGFTKADKETDGGTDPTDNNELDILFQVTFQNGITTYWDLSTTVPPPPPNPGLPPNKGR